jgi:GNAT superfamily N-acetyltransferase
VSSYLGFGERERLHELLALRSRSYVSRIAGEWAGDWRTKPDGWGPDGRWIELGGAFAFDWRGARCVLDFGGEALRSLTDLLDWFGSGPAPSFETLCGEPLELTAEALISLGYRPCHTHAFFAASLAELATCPAAPTAVVSTDARDFARLGAQVWNDGDPERAHALACQHAGPEWICVTAIEADCPVAGATLFLDGPHAYHANAITLPEARGRGLHAELLRMRIDLARARGKAWIVADTQYGSGSGRNLERAGLRCVGTSLTWRA